MRDSLTNATRLVWARTCSLNSLHASNCTIASSPSTHSCTHCCHHSKSVEAISDLQTAIAGHIAVKQLQQFPKCTCDRQSLNFCQPATMSIDPNQKSDKFTGVYSRKIGTSIGSLRQLYHLWEIGQIKSGQYQAMMWRRNHICRNTLQLNIICRLTFVFPRLPVVICFCNPENLPRGYNQSVKVDTWYLGNFHCFVKEFSCYCRRFFVSVPCRLPGWSSQHFLDSFESCHSCADPHLLRSLANGDYFCIVKVFRLK